YLGRRVTASPLLELMAPVALNLVNFRYAAGGLSDDETDQLNIELLMRLQERGIAVPSSTRIHDRYAIRAAIVNHRTRFSDMDILVDAVESIGAEIVAK
ncbi:MAG: amino acid decarboxylase, partial [Gemmatimonadota bacterium]|nr:amino acid decarboxylase [Gemmatimonadota bacterium]